LIRLNILQRGADGGSGIGAEVPGNSSAKLLKFGAALLNSGKPYAAPRTDKANLMLGYVFPADSARTGAEADSLAITLATPLVRARSRGRAHRQDRDQTTVGSSRRSRETVGSAGDRQDGRPPIQRSTRRRLTKGPEEFRRCGSIGPRQRAANVLGARFLADDCRRYFGGGWLCLSCVQSTRQRHAGSRCESRRTAANFTELARTARSNRSGPKRTG
jgi:hypothetical protein